MRSAAPLMQQLDQRAADVSSADADDDRLSTICVALLGQYGRIEDAIKAGGTDSLDFNGFSALVDSLDVQCSVADKKKI